VHATEVRTGDRFSFGANWARFLSVLDDDRIEEAKSSLKQMLNVESLKGRSFLDVGSGSGLFSLAARLLAARVHSFDFDPQSAACTAELKQRYFEGDNAWLVESGSVLDREYLSRLGQFDVVYSWGVLHHTGRMWEALENVVPLVKPNGLLFISIYNNQGGATRRWKFLKRVYNKHPALRNPLIVYTLVRQWTLTFLRDAFHGNPLTSWQKYKTMRGMSAWHDVVDWIGGYPFEVAKPEEIFEFYRGAGFNLEKLRTCGGGLGCNEFVFRKG
jgi:2-polyprenyl-3-methyl-5-hydroxy-6-metoxy-1,4-benzoquinol methylase